ncbi:hypothetical protein NPIL_297751 [Nephila pilipes]|uniref:Uncharacterized protein n=1 Tax=Nephila pilipes TaxID=299642 RepID=A0A8X6TVY7_NEPPI|nr:hypothetical protein NPIL_297751 [Nephila pilipes]
MARNNSSLSSTGFGEIPYPLEMAEAWAEIGEGLSTFFSRGQTIGGDGWRPFNRQSPLILSPLLCPITTLTRELYELFSCGWL